MALNKNHPDCPAYTRKWDELCKKMDEEIEALPSPTPMVRNDSVMAIHRKYAKKLKALQIEYAHLFE